MRKLLIGAPLITVLLTLVGVGPPARANRASPQTRIVSRDSSILSALSSYFTKKELEAGVYVGSEYCIACHPDYAGWRDTLHADALIRPMVKWSLVPGKGVLADYDNNGVDDFVQGLDFNTISSPFDQYKPNAPKLSVKNGQYTITIGKLDMPVVFVKQWRWPDTGEWFQLFAVRVPVADSPTGYTSAVYSSPLDYVTEGNTWEAYAPEAWYGSDNQPLFGPAAATSQVVPVGESWDQNCAGCHASGTRSVSQNSRGEWAFQPYPATIYNVDDPGYFDYDGDGNKKIMNIGCESCHGPGSQHILGLHDPTKIVNPAKLGTHDANQICGQCHSVIASTPTGVIGWPYQESTGMSWLPGSGEQLRDFATAAEVWWPDNKIGIDTSQYPEFYNSTKPSFQFHPVRCTECHDPHKATGNPAQIVSSIAAGSLTISTRVEDNTLCLACHATHGSFANITQQQVADYADNRTAIGAVVESHSHHPYGPERAMGLSRCTGCHMATTGGPDELKLHTHTFEAVPPEKTLKYQDQGGMPNACALSCHRSKVNSFDLGLDSDPVTVWDNAFEKSLATALQAYYGPGGKWWDTAKPAGNARAAASFVISKPSGSSPHSGSHFQHRCTRRQSALKPKTGPGP